MPLLWLSLSFILGILLSVIVQYSWQVWLGLSILPFISIFIPTFSSALKRKQPALYKSLYEWPPIRSIRRVIKRLGKYKYVQTDLVTISVLLPLIFIALFFGAARYSASMPKLSPNFVAWYNDTEDQLVITGVIESPPDIRDAYINLRIRTERLRSAQDFQQIDIEGLILARVPIDGEWHYGDRVILRGKLETPPENDDFSYRDYLATQAIFAFMPYADASLLESNQGNTFKQVVFTFKQSALNYVYQLFPDPEAALIAGILLGVESGIPRDVRAAFNQTGTAHIIVISGFNITILAALFTKYFSNWLGRRKGAILAVITISVYTVLVGADPPVVRAAVMGVLALIAREVGRRQDGINSLTFVAAVMALLTPQIVWDVGFQLSFAATLGMVLYVDPLTNLYVKLVSPYISKTSLESSLKPISEYLLITLAASLMTLPIILFHFKRLSLSFLPANIAILPAQPFIMLISGLAVLCAFVFLPLGQLIAYAAWPFVLYTIRMVEWIAGFPGGSIATGPVSIGIVIVFYVLIFAFTIKWEKVKTFLLPFSRSVSFIAILMLVTLVWNFAVHKPDAKLHITLFDVGTGDAILIKSPTGRYILIGGGPATTKLSDGLGRRMPIIQRQLDYLIVASTQQNQVAALPAMIERYAPSQVYWSGAANASQSARYLTSKINSAGIPIITATPSESFDLGAGVKLEVLKTNRRGAVLLLIWNDFRMLIPLGLDFEAIDQLGVGSELAGISVMLLADNGYAPLNPQSWIDFLNPNLILLSVASGDYDGLPSPELLEYIQAYPLLRTDQNGWIELVTDGSEFWVTVERGVYED